MNWYKVVAGFVLMIGVLIAWYRVMRGLRGGGSGSRMDLPGKPERQPNRRAEEMERFIALQRSGAGTSAASGAAPPAVAAVAAARAPDTAGLAVPPESACPTAPPTLLSGHHKLAYLLFKAALPGHLVFPGIALSRIAPATAAPGQTSQHSIALVVCRADLTVVAAVDFAEAGTLGHGGTERALRACGVMHVTIDPKVLPRREKIPQLLQLTETDS